MEGCSRTRDWKRPLRWLLWWKIDPEELRRETEGYGTLRWFCTARGLSLVLATLAGAGRWLLAGLFVTHGLHGRSQSVVLLVDSTLLAEGFLFFVLGGFAYRGKRSALGGLMALWTISLAWLDIWYIQYQIATYGFYVYPLQTSIPAAIMVLGWPVGMHVFYVASRVERERTRAA